MSLLRGPFVKSPLCNLMFDNCFTTQFKSLNGTPRDKTLLVDSQLNGKVQREHYVEQRTMFRRDVSLMASLGRLKLV